MRIESVEQPYDDHEKNILKQIDDIRAEYLKAIEPLSKMFADSRSRKLNMFIMVPDAREQHRNDDAE